MDTSNPVAPPGMFFRVKAGPRVIDHDYYGRCSGIIVELRKRRRGWFSVLVHSYEAREHEHRIDTRRVREVMESCLLGYNREKEEQNKYESLSGDYPPKKLS